MNIQNKYLVFVYDMYYPSGGFFDLKLILDDINTLRGDLQRFAGRDLVQIIDTEDQKVAFFDLHDFLNGDEDIVKFEDFTVGVGFDI